MIQIIKIQGRLWEFKDGKAREMLNIEADIYKAQSEVRELKEHNKFLRNEIARLEEAQQCTEQKPET